MTCEQIRLHLSGSCMDELPAAAAIHLEQCTACRHAATAHAKLASDLRLLRDSPTAVPRSLDDAVLTAFRRTMHPAVVHSLHSSASSVQNANSPSDAKPTAKRLFWLSGVGRSLFSSVSSVLNANNPSDAKPSGKRLFWLSGVGRSLFSSVPSVLNANSPSHAKRSGKRLFWLSAVLTLAAIAALLLHPRHLDQMQAWSPPTPHAAAISHTPELPKPHAVVAVKRPHPAQLALTPVSGFQSLMYCDPLSCPGAMDVIRIQIPVSAVNRLPASRPANGYVQADVVVGSDGFARAIRIVH
jgi:hypothetical protein